MQPSALTSTLSESFSPMSRLAYVALRWLTPRLQEHGRGAERSQRSAGNKRGFHPFPVRGAHHFAKICSASSAIVFDRPERASRSEWLLSPSNRRVTRCSRTECTRRIRLTRDLGNDTLGFSDLFEFIGPPQRHPLEWRPTPADPTTTWPSWNPHPKRRPPRSERERQQAMLPAMMPVGPPNRRQRSQGRRSNQLAQQWTSWAGRSCPLPSSSGGQPVTE